MYSFAFNLSIPVQSFSIEQIAAAQYTKRKSVSAPIWIGVKLKKDACQVNQFIIKYIYS